MSRTVDEKVVSMQFDNRRFESNVQTSMSTLDKLKAKLDFTGAGKGLDSVGKAANNVNMSGLGGAVETVQAKFSALEVIGVTALANITNSAVNAGKRMVSALTIDPIKSGFQEYETQMGAVQTILANTSSKGSTLDDVNNALEELNKYADQTIYNFTEMTRNIGTFTAAGVDLDTSVNAIQGIANLAAVSGSTSQQASTAMYQLSQALAAGTVKLMDWNSVVNAGMGGEIFQNALKETSAALGTGAEAAIKAQGSFRESLKTGWLTSEVLTETLKKFTSTGAVEYVADYTGLSTEAINAALKSAEAQYGEADAIEHAAKALAKKSGKSADQIKETLQFAKTAQDAATKVKTFTQLWDVLKESAQSGWSQTWKLIVGDFEEAKNLLSPLAEFLTGVIGKMSDARNRVLQIGLKFYEPWKAIMDKLNGAGFGKIKDVIKTVGDLTDKLEYYQDVVTRVWRGDYNNQGDNPDRRDLLKADGYNEKIVQHLVNKGYLYKLTVEDLEEAYKKFGLTMEESSEKTTKTSKAIAGLTDEQLKSAGLTKEEISLYRALAKEADRMGISFEDLVERMSKKDGRTRLIDAFKNLGDVLTGLGKTAKKAFVEIFDPPSLEQLGIRLYVIIETFEKFTEKLRFTDKETGKLNETGKKFQRIFKGVFAIVDLLAIVIGGPLKIAFEIFKSLLGAIDIDILGFVALLSDGIVKVHDWIKGFLNFSWVFEKLEPHLTKAKDAIKNFIDNAKPLERISNFFEKLSTKFKAWIESLKDSKNLPEDIAKGIASGFSKAINFIKTKLENFKDLLQNGFADASDSSIGRFAKKLWGGIKLVGKVMLELGKIMLESLNKFLASHGLPQIPTNIIDGLVNGIKAGLGRIASVALDIGKIIINKVKEILGIHSPSAVFFAIGGFLISGLVLGLTNGFPAVKEALQGLGGAILDGVKNIDLGSVFSALSMILTLFIGKKFTDAIENFSAPFEGIGEVLEAVAETVLGFNKYLKAKSFKTVTEGIKDLAMALLIIVGALAVVTFLNPDRLWESVVIIGVLAGILAGLTLALSALSKSSAKIGKDGVQINGLKASLISIGAAVLLMAYAVKIVGTLDEDEASQGFLGLTGIVLAIIGVVAAYGKLVKGKAAMNIDKAGRLLTKLAGAMLIMAWVANIMGGMSWDKMAKAGVGMLGFVGIITLLILISKIAGKHVDRVGITVSKIATAMLTLVAVAIIINMMSWKAMGKAAVGLLGLVGIISILIAATKLAGPHVNRLGATMIGIAGAMAILVFVCNLIVGMEWAEMGKAAVGLLGLVAIVAILVGIVKTVEKDAPKIAGTLLALSVSIGVLGFVVTLLGLLSIEHLAKGLIAVGLLSAMVGALIKSTANAKNCSKNLIVMTVAIGILAIALAALSFIDPTRLAVAGAVLSSTIGMFALLVTAAKRLKVKNLAQFMVPLLTLVGVVGILTGLIFILSKINAKAALTGAGALSMLLVSMSASLLILSFMGNTGVQALIGVGLLTAMVVPLLAFIGVLALMGKVSNAIENASALVTLATIMTLLMVPLTVIGAFWAPALIGIGLLTAMAVPLRSFVGVLALMANIKDAESNATLLIRLMETLTKVLVVVTIVGPLASIGIFALASLTTFMLALGVLAVGIGALMELCPDIQKFLNIGIPVLIQLAEGIGRMLGAFVSGIVVELESGLPEIGRALSDFMEEAGYFIENVGKVDDKVKTGVGILVDSILQLTGADFVARLASIGKDGVSFKEIGAALSEFMDEAREFTTGASELKPETATNIKTLIEAISALTDANFKDGITSLFKGESSLTEFGDQLGQLGSDLATFVKNIGTFSETQVVTVKCAADAIKALASAAKEIPNEGGLWASIVGENSLATFGGYLSALGTNIADFVSNLGTFAEDQVNTVKCACDAITALAAAAKEIPNEGGLWASIVGENSLATFGEKLPTLGTNIADFVNNLGTFTDDQVRTVECASNAIKALAAAANSIPNEGGFWASIVGDNSLSTFSANLPGLGTNIAEFVKNLGVIDEEKIATVNSAVGVMKAIAKLGEADMGDMKSDIGGFGKKLPELATKISSFCTVLSEVNADSIKSASDKIKSVINMAKSVASVDIDSVKSFGDALKSLGTNGVQNFINGIGAKKDDAKKKLTELINACTKHIKSGDHKTAFKEAAKELIKKFNSGIIDKKKDVKTRIGEMVEAARKKIKNKTNYDDFKAAGKYLVEGFANGIKNNKKLASDAGSSLGKAALKAAKEALDEQSPSKEMYKVGDFAGIGFVNALYDNVKKAYTAGTEMAGSAKSGLSKAIAKIGEMVNSDMDMQPTIRPVLDLSDIRSGAGAIGSMLGFNSRIGVAANIGAISSSMARGQNGTNSEVVSAINKLRKDVANMPRESYNINGVNVAEGSDAADAIETLVRFIKIEGRS